MSDQTSGKRNISYDYYYSKVVIKRMGYFKNVVGLLAVILSISLRVLFGHFWWNLLLTILIRGPLLFLGFMTLKISRDKYTTVEFTPFKTLGSQIYYSLLSKKFFIIVLCYSVSSLVLYLVFISQLSFKYDYAVLSKEYGRKPIVNDEWVHYWFHAVYIAFIYSAQHLTFQRNRLNFRYGISKVRPDDSLMKKLPNLLGNAIFLNLIVGLSSPIVYCITRPIIYKFNWPALIACGLDTSIPKFYLSFRVLFQISFVSFHVLLSWEILNHVYNVYSTIGCLDGKKPISTYSSDPINTLLSGLRSTEPQYQISRLAAFQELAYIASTNDPEGVKLRVAIYSAHSKFGFIWPAILDECSLVIKGTTARINYRSPSDLKYLQLDTVRLDDGLISPLPKDSSTGRDIFGNSNLNNAHKEDKKKSSKYDMKKYPEASNETSSEAPFRQLFKFLENNILKYLPNSVFSWVSSILKTPKGFILELHHLVERLEKDGNQYYKKFLDSKFGIFFRRTLKRDTESRVLNPVNFGNAVFAISDLIIHSIEEDKNSCVTTLHVSEVFNLLEKPIRATKNYSDYLPSSVYLTQSQRTYKQLKLNHLVVLLHDLAMNKFFQMCIEFNFKLNDLLLNARTFKLAKWVIDVAIAHQQQQGKME
ncbi:uncharacterized protein PRCAT00001042001 [Priceomyces carsonii]|uniref:uncharacterized protein n=1 Tax=Priceomyces carsonii TaxID=28549 RepID=UPI002ED8407E|nr:unnamed protein product [Priceomyces carsonii]